MRTLIIIVLLLFFGGCEICYAKDISPHVQKILTYYDYDVDKLRKFASDRRKVRKILKWRGEEVMHKFWWVEHNNPDMYGDILEAR